MRVVSYSGFNVKIEPWSKEVSELFDAVKIHSANDFFFADQHIQFARLPVKSEIDPLRALLAKLQGEIYASCYCRRFRGRFTRVQNVDLSSDDIGESLSSANLGRGRWEAGWIVAKVEPARIWAERQGRTQWFWPGQLTIDGASRPSLGALVNVYLSKEDVHIQPGFYMALSESTLDELDQLSLVRLYWNVNANGAFLLLRFLTERLNRFRIPFRFKCPRYKSHFDRRDAAVLYVARRLYPLTMRLVTECYRQTKPYLNPETPLFSKMLAPGLGLAEDPGNGESFGVKLSRLLAEAICNAYGKNLQTREARFEELATLFCQNRLDPSRPYLSPNSKDDYHLELISAEEASD